MKADGFLLYDERTQTLRVFEDPTVLRPRGHLTRHLLVDGGLDHGEVGVVLRGAAVGDDT